MVNEPLIFWWMVSNRETSKYLVKDVTSIVASYFLPIRVNDIVTLVIDNVTFENVLISDIHYEQVKFHFLESGAEHSYSIEDGLKLIQSTIV